MPMLWAFRSPTQSKAAMEASTAVPFFFKMSLENTRMHLTVRKHTCRTKRALGALLPSHFWTLSSISSYSSLGVEVVWRKRRAFPPQAHEHPQKQAHCSHQKDHQTSDQGLPNHFPAQDKSTQLIIRLGPSARTQRSYHVQHSCKMIILIKTSPTFSCFACLKCLKSFGANRGQAKCFVLSLPLTEY